MNAISDYVMIAHYVVGAAALAAKCTLAGEPPMIVTADAYSAACWAWKARDEAAFLELEGTAP